MRAILTAGFLLIHLSAFAQQSFWSDEGTDDPQESAVKKYNDMLRFHDPLMYLAYPYITPLRDRPIPLRNGEGTNGYLAEGQFAYRFVIYKGKYYSYPLLQRMRLTLDINLQLRLTADSSYPLLPTNNKGGIGWDFLWSNPEKMNEDRATLVWSTVQLHHYSNGREDSFFINDPVQRNNYRGGDFSTNYLRGMLNVSSHRYDKNIFTIGVGYQREIDFGGPLSISSEFRNYYGYDRALFSFQWARRPNLSVSEYHNRATSSTDKVRIERRRQIMFRTELQYILGDLSRFPGRDKYRLGWHSYLTYMPSITNEVGFLAHTYVGRDYLNMRFDDPVFVAELGVCVHFNSR